MSAQGQLRRTGSFGLMSGHRVIADIGFCSWAFTASMAELLPLALNLQMLATLP